MRDFILKFFASYSFFFLGGSHISKHCQGLSVTSIELTALSLITMENVILKEDPVIQLWNK